jgi:hypothetical protein
MNDNELRNMIYGMLGLGAIAVLGLILGASYAESVSLECTKAALEKNLTTIEIMELCK